MPAKKRRTTPTKPAPEPAADSFRVPQEKVLSVGRFLTDFRDTDQACLDERFCFIVGSGASSPIIPSGSTLVDRWLVEMHDMDCPDKDRLRPPHAKLAEFAGALLPGEEARLRAWAEKTFADLPSFQWKSRAEHYGRIYQRRFASRPHIGQEFLRELMHARPPALGHHLLGRLLARTRHHVVITTNFDRLVEDAVAITERIAVQSFGSKDLAQYLQREQRGPVVAKIHGDLQLETYNTLDDIQSLRKEWEKALTTLLSRYTPIVTGYGGNDPGFMSYLIEALPGLMGNRSLYWVLRSKDKPIKNPWLQRLAALDCVRFIEGLGFTELMVRLNDCYEYPPLEEELQKTAADIASALKTATAEAREKINATTGTLSMDIGAPPTDPAAVPIPPAARTWREWIDALDFASSATLRHALLEEARIAFPDHPAIEATALQLDGRDSPQTPEWKTGIETHLERAEKAFGPEAPETLSCLNSLAVLLYERGDLAGAEPLFRRALEAYERTLGPEAPDTLSSLNNLAILLKNQGDLTGAEPLYRRALEAQERTLGPEDPDTLSSLNNLALLLKNRGDLSSAEPLFRRSLEARERTQGPEHPHTLSGVNNLALLLYERGDLTGAEPLYRRALDARERTLGPEHPDTLGSLNNLGSLREAQARLAEAEVLYARAVAGAQAKLLPEHPHRQIFERNLARVRARLGRQGRENGKMENEK